MFQVNHRNGLLALFRCFKHTFYVLDFYWKKECKSWYRTKKSVKREYKNKFGENKYKKWAESGTRTRDLLITNELLYQLSYFGFLELSG